MMLSKIVGSILRLSFLAPGFGKNVMNVNLFVEEGLLLDWFPFDEVAATLTHKERVYPLVSGTIAGSERQQPVRLKVSISNYCRLVFASSDPIRDFRKISGKQCIGGATVHLSEYPTPEPPGYFRAPSLSASSLRSARIAANGTTWV